MPTYLALLHMFGGIVWLLMGGDVLVRGAISLATKIRISPLIVGLTVVAFGTSAPELVVSLRAALVGYPDLAIANVVGSNIANVLLVVGLPAIVYPMACDQPGVAADGRVMMGATVLFFALCALGALGRVQGIVLLIGLGLFLAHVVRSSSLKQVWASETPDESQAMERILGLPTTTTMIGLFLVLGAIALPLGAELLIRGGIGFAEALGVPNSVIGLTMVALGTSLPELATTLVAAFKKEAELAVGNVIGSNVLNLLAIMGVTALVSPIPIEIPDRFLSLNLPVMFAAALVLTIVTSRRGTVGRGLGATLLAGYVMYNVVLF